MTSSDPFAAVTVVRDEVTRVLDDVSAEQFAAARALFDDRARRWFCCGQGRSGLVAQMVAMRLMHLGFDVHAIGEATTPAMGAGDGLLAFSGSGETPITVHLAELARGFGATILAVTGHADSTLGRLADVTIELAASATRQFGGTLFEQGALLTSDALALAISGDDERTQRAMQARHSNLQ